jgi:DNA adenine methylase
VRSLLKFAGAKGWLVDQYAAAMPLPDRGCTYYEPFLGSGAAAKLYLKMAWGAVRVPCRLSDSNVRLMDMYMGVRDDAGEVCKCLGLIMARHDGPSAYYRERDAFNARDPKESLAMKAARFIYMNKAGFNGLLREARNGNFNVPYGKYHAAGDCGGTHATKLAAEKCVKLAKDFESGKVAFAGKHNAIGLPTLGDLVDWSTALEGVSLAACSFEEALTRVKRGDAIYLDPPYVPATATANFTGYTAAGFGPYEQAALVRQLDDLDRRGAKFLLSNAITAKGLYTKWEVREVIVERSISCKPKTRAPVKELLVANYALYSGEPEKE